MYAFFSAIFCLTLVSTKAQQADLLGLLANGFLGGNGGGLNPAQFLGGGGNGIPFLGGGGGGSNLLGGFLGGGNRGGLVGQLLGGGGGNGLLPGGFGGGNSLIPNFGGGGRQAVNPLNFLGGLGGVGNGGGDGLPDLSQLASGFLSPAAGNFLGNGNSNPLPFAGNRRGPPPGVINQFLGGGGNGNRGGGFNPGIPGVQQFLGAGQAQPRANQFQFSRNGQNQPFNPAAFRRGFNNQGQNFLGPRR